MNGTMPARDQRIVLWLVCAGAVWRWLVAMRTPLPGIDASTDLWLAAQLAAGSWGELAARWTEPGWSLLLAPAIAAGAPPFVAAQVGACLLGALTAWPVACAAERLREGAGVSAAVLAMVAAGPSVAAGTGSAVGCLALVVAFAVWAASCARWRAALALAAIVAIAGGDVLTPSAGSLRTLRLAIGAAFVLSPLAWLAPRPPHLRGLAVVLALVVGGACVGAEPLAWWPVWSPIAAVLAGVGLVRLSSRWRELLLCVAVAAECYGAWQEIEPRPAVAERAIGRFLARRLAPEQEIVSDLPRVLWAAGQRPIVTPTSQLPKAAQATRVGALVLGPAVAESATTTASLAGTFARCDLAPDLTDLVAARGLRVLIRR